MKKLILFSFSIILMHCVSLNTAFSQPGTVKALSDQRDHQTETIKNLRIQLKKIKEQINNSITKYERNAGGRLPARTLESLTREMFQAFSTLREYNEKLIVANNELMITLNELTQLVDVSKAADIKKEILAMKDSMRYYQTLVKNAAEKEKNASEEVKYLMEQLRQAQILIQELQQDLALQTTICIKEFKIDNCKGNLLDISVQLESEVRDKEMHLDIEIWKQKTNKSTFEQIAANSKDYTIGAKTYMSFESSDEFSRDNGLGINRCNYMVKINYTYKGRSGPALVILINDMKPNSSGINIIQSCVRP